MNQTLKTILACFFAVNLTGLGVALLVQANLGSEYHYSIYRWI